MNSNSVAAKIINKDISLKYKFFFVINSVFVYFFCRPLGVVHVVEFPKCGGSWVRNMIRTYNNNSLFLNDKLVSKNDVILAHKKYRKSYKKPVLVVRDPRDMYVSFYHYETTYVDRSEKTSIVRYYKHDAGIDVKDDFNNYLQAKLLNSSHPWFYYSQFIDSWIKRPDICLVRYEDCLEQPENELVRMVRFLDYPVAMEKIKNVVEETSFSSITKKKYGESRVPGQVDNSKFHRKGVSGDWRNYFNRSSCEIIEKFEGHTLRQLGYENDKNWVARFLDE